MSETHTKYLDTFPAWLRSLAADAEALGQVLEVESVPREAKEALAGGLNYLFKSLDLIPDGIDDIGYLDDAFVLRVSAELATREDLGSVAPDTMEKLSALANDVDVIKEFLESDYERLETYVKGLKKGAARGRSVGDILGDDGIRQEFISDIHGFAKGYESPSFAREEKNLIKLKAFFDAKLPR